MKILITRFLFLFSVIIILFVYSLSAQTNIYFERATENGLYTMVGRAVVCDKNDFIYFGTNDGLYKYDGYIFKKFPSTGTGSSVCPLVNIRTLFYDGNLIWLGGPEGFASYDPEQGNFKKYTASFDKATEEKPGVRGFFKFDDTTLVLSTYRSYTILYARSGRMENIQLPETFPKTEISFTVRITTDRLQHLWIATAEDGIYYAANLHEKPQKAANIFPPLNDFPSNRIVDIVEYKEDELLVGTTEGLYTVNPSSGTWKNIELENEVDGNTKPYVKKILKLNESGDLFIATLGSGLFHYIAKENRFQDYAYKYEWYNGLPDNFINDIAAGKNGYYWLALEDVGLVKINSWLSRYEYVLLPPLSDKKSAFTVTDIDQDGDEYYLTTGDGFVKYGADKKFTYLGTSFSSYAGEYLQMLNKLNDNLYTFIIYGSSIGVFDKQKNTFGYLQPPGKNIMGDEIVFDWLSFVDDDLNYYLVDFEGNYMRCNYRDNTIDTLFTPAQVSLALPVVIPESKNTLWIMSASRLYYFDIRTKELTKITQDKNGNKLPPATFQEDLVARQNGMLYIASDEGFFAYDHTQNTLQKYTTENGLSTNNCFSLFQDNDHKLYIQATNAISYFNEDTKKILSYPVPRTEGLTGTPFIDKKNNLLIGADNCFLKIPLDSLAPYSVKPILKILSVRAGNKELNLQNIEKGLSVHYKDFPLQITYQLTDYFGPVKNEVTYTLAGWDPDWTTDKTQSFRAIYSKVTPGNYVFQIRGRDAVNPEHTELSIPLKVLPPFWQTWWFITLIVLSIIIIPYLIYRYRLNQLRQIQIIRNKIAADLHDDVGSTLSSIRMYSDIVHRQVKDKSPEAVPVLEKMSDNSREMIENMSDIVWAIKPANDAFKNIESRMLNFAAELCNAKNIELDMERNETMDEVKIKMEQRKDLYLIFKEAVNNAVKYSECTKLKVRFSKSNNVFVMMVSDNGKGFTPGNGKSGNGLDNMRKRAENQKGKLEIESAPNAGTTIKLIFNLD